MLADRTFRADGTLPDGEGQPDRTAPSVHVSGPQTRVGSVQRVRAHH